MKIYLAKFCLNKDNDCFETISVHYTQVGAEQALKKHMEYVYDNADIFFKGDDKQLNMCIWDWEEMNLQG